METLFQLVNNQERKWDRHPSASVAEIDALNLAVQHPLPNIYLEFLRISNGGEGMLGIDPGWFQIWSASDVLGLNKAYQISEFLPGYFGFGSNGGDELLALKLSLPEAPVFMVPFIPLSEAQARQITPSFEEFLGQLGRLNNFENSGGA
jgi:SMI1 / KNR4 family (SUKH-1)